MKLLRVLNVLAVLLLIGSAAVVYNIKYQSTRQAVEIDRLNRQIAREKSKIAVLEAEWAHLVRPDRIQNLAEKHLDLKPADPRQRMALADLPMRPAKVDSIAETLASLGTDTPIADEVQAQPADDPIGRTIEAMGLAMPSSEDRVDRAMRELGIGAGASHAGRALR